MANLPTVGSALYEAMHRRCLLNLNELTGSDNGGHWQLSAVHVGSWVVFPYFFGDDPYIVAGRVSWGRKNNKRTITDVAAFPYDVEDDNIVHAKQLWVEEDTGVYLYGDNVQYAYEAATAASEDFTINEFRMAIATETGMPFGLVDDDKLDFDHICVAASTVDDGPGIFNCTLDKFED